MIDIDSLSPEMLEAVRAMHKAGIHTPTAMLTATKASMLGVVEHMETFFYIPETGKPIILEPHQKVIFRLFSGAHNYQNLLPFYSTVEYSTPKKHGKTSGNGGYTRWRAESPTLNDEILFFANDETQSRGRAYEAIAISIKLSPLYDPQKRVLYDEFGNPVWRIIEDYLEHIPTATKIRAVNVDYRGEAGANPSLTCWTEAWGYDTDKQVKLFDEMTPVLTRERSQRYVEGYAGYTGKSKVLEHVENLATNEELGARQLTIDDIPDWPWKDEEKLPIWVNDTAGIAAYLDRGDICRRRMPWLTGPDADRYYTEQALTLTPEQYDRLHRNMWVSPVTAFIPTEWVKSCGDAQLLDIKPWRVPVSNGIQECPEIGDYEKIAAYIDPSNWQIVGEPVPLVAAGDASVSGDCTALDIGGRHPQRHQDVVLYAAYLWNPPKGGKIDYDTTPNSVTGLSFRQQLLTACMMYNVVELGYDEWQLHHLTNELRRDAIVWCRAFKQGVERDIADKQLYDLLKNKRLTYNPDNPNICLSDLLKHFAGAARQQKPHEDTKLHIIKAGDESKIDLVVALSMMSAEILRLDL